MPQIVRFNGVIYRTNANQDELEWSISGFDVTWSWAGSLTAKIFLNFN